MANIEARTVGIVGRNESTIAAFRKSLNDRKMSVQTFQDKLALLNAAPKPDILILSEKTGITGIEKIPRIVLGSGKEGDTEDGKTATIALEEGALDYIYTRHSDSLPKPAQDVAAYTAAKIYRLFNANRWEVPEPTIITIGNFSLNIDLNRLTINENVIKLRPRCIPALAFLMQKADEMVPFREIINFLEYDGMKTPMNNVKTCISEIRKRLGSEKRRHIKTIRNGGYMFVTNP